MWSLYFLFGPILCNSPIFALLHDFLKFPWPPDAVTWPVPAFCNVVSSVANLLKVRYLFELPFIFRVTRVKMFCERRVSLSFIFFCFLAVYSPNSAAGCTWGGQLQTQPDVNESIRNKNLEGFQLWRQFPGFISFSATLCKSSRTRFGNTDAGTLHSRNVIAFLRIHLCSRQLNGSSGFYASSENDKNWQLGLF